MKLGKQARGWFWLTTTAIIGGIVSAGPGATTASAQTPPAASGAPATVTVSIPAGPLENAILSFGRQANLRMVYPSAITGVAARSASRARSAYRRQSAGFWPDRD
ncbi:UNVERIFIED_ORG: hypothetical protein QE446_001580 [Rhizobium sp. SORGH_AS260]|nr:hypothetical protein [Rhizobium sp. SORGH_AS_0285]MDP9753723.1 hypothetical protein [Rhizobium sp. SORGH_AS_0260]MDR6080698.1 hypothetical protein [Agrobacterium sp. SORGH_AS_0440]